MIDHAMAWVFAVELGVLEDLAHEPRVFRATDEAGDLPVARDASRGNLGDDREHLVGKLVIEHAFVAGRIARVMKEAVVVQGCLLIFIFKKVYAKLHG